MIHTVSFEPDPGNQRSFRTALGRFATGVTVITTRTPGGKLEGLTANSFSAVSLDPPLVLWSLKQHAPSLKSFLEAGYFAVNVLEAGQVALARHFAAPRRDKFDDLPYVAGLGGCPLLPGTLAAFECSTHATLDGGDHVIFLGRVHRASHGDGEPLIFSAGRYCTHPLGPARHEGR
jgi:flavin reductase (DIM6/NTAB) family NADH-FMN oxidoreductase RutF